MRYRMGAPRRRLKGLAASVRGFLRYRDPADMYDNLHMFLSDVAGDNFDSDVCAALRGCFNAACLIAQQGRAFRFVL